MKLNLSVGPDPRENSDEVDRELYRFLSMSRKATGAEKVEAFRQYMDGKKIPSISILEEAEIRRILNYRTSTTNNIMFSGDSGLLHDIESVLDVDKGITVKAMHEFATSIRFRGRTTRVIDVYTIGIPYWGRWDRQQKSDDTMNDLSKKFKFGPQYPEVSKLVTPLRGQEDENQIAPWYSVTIDLRKKLVRVMNSSDGDHSHVLDYFKQWVDVQLKPWVEQQYHTTGDWSLEEDYHIDRATHTGSWIPVCFELLQAAENDTCCPYLVKKDPTPLRNYVAGKIATSWCMSK